MSLKLLSIVFVAVCLAARYLRSKLPGSPAASLSGFRPIRVQDLATHELVEVLARRLESDVEAESKKAEALARVDRVRAVLIPREKGEAPTVSTPAPPPAAPKA